MLTGSGPLGSSQNLQERFGLFMLLLLSTKTIGNLGQAQCLPEGRRSARYC